MSKVADDTGVSTPTLGDVASAPRAREAPGALRNTLFRVALVAFAAAIPFMLEPFWLNVGVLAMVAAIGAIGLNLLVGSTGQLSIAHAAYLGIGAYSYCYFASPSTTVTTGTGTLRGLGLPPIVAIVLAVVLAGVAGLIFSPIAARLRGIYLGVASIGLVFLVEHILFNATTFTGGFNGRPAPTFRFAGLIFAEATPSLYVLNVRFGRVERLWYLMLFFLVVSYWFARNILRGRPGRALQAVRDREVAAAVMGVDLSRYKAQAFLISSMYAGLAGALFAIALRAVVPETFGLLLSFSYLAMIVIGGLGSVGGAVAGAVFVTALPETLKRYSADIGFLAQPGSGGIGAAEAAAFLYGAAIIAFLIFEPGGLAGLGRRLTRLGSRRTRHATPGVSTAPTQASGPQMATGGGGRT